MWRWAVVVSGAWAGGLVGCADDPKLGLGGQCELNSECDAPLVCRIERCRRQCVTDRDCALGLHCFYDQEGLGACQLPEEKTCTLDSECPAPLVCPMGECTPPCMDDEDCPPDAACEDMSCVFPEQTGCVYTSECPLGMVCSRDQRCRVECTTDLDCQSGRVCIGVVVTDDGAEGCDYYCEFPGALDSSTECFSDGGTAGGG